MPQSKISSRRTEHSSECSSSGVPGEKLGRNVERVENQNAPLHDANEANDANDVDEAIEAGDGDSSGEDEQRVGQRLPLQRKRRKINPTGTGVKGNISREIQEMIRHYENQEENPDGRRMYQVAGTKIYLGEGVEASAALWFLLQQKKPTIFFRDMIEFIWPKYKLLNRCLNREKVTTKLLDRSPRKELTPRKKRLGAGRNSERSKSQRAEVPNYNNTSFKTAEGQKGELFISDA